jgi:polyisoprenoid-binding protein YceI
MTHPIKPYLLSILAGASLALIGCSNASSADQLSAPTQETAPVSPPAISTTNINGNWDIQSEGSHIKFTAKQEGEPFTGSFEGFTGVINFDPAAPETATVEIKIPLSSVDAGSKDRNSTLPGKVWFSTKKFPEAIFTSSEISTADNGYIARGALSLKGKSVPVDLPFALSVEGRQAVMSARIKIDRTRWDVGAAPWDTDEWVSREVELDIQVTATRKP